MNGADAIGPVEVASSFDDAQRIARRMLREARDVGEGDEDPGHEFEVHGNPRDPLGFYLADGDGLVQVVARRIEPRR